MERFCKSHIHTVQLHTFTSDQRACLSPTLWALASSSFSLSYPFSRTSITDGLRRRDRLSLKALHSSPSSPDRKLASTESASRPGTLQQKNLNDPVFLQLWDLMTFQLSCDPFCSVTIIYTLINTN